MLPISFSFFIQRKIAVQIQTMIEYAVCVWFSRYKMKCWQSNQCVCVCICYFFFWVWEKTNRLCMHDIGWMPLLMLLLLFILYACEFRVNETVYSSNKSTIFGDKGHKLSVENRMDAIEGLLWFFSVIFCAFVNFQSKYYVALQLWMCWPGLSFVDRACNLYIKIQKFYLIENVVAIWWLNVNIRIGCVAVTRYGRRCHHLCTI